jgi:hypothetical protein
MPIPMIGPNGTNACRSFSGGKTTVSRANPCGIINDPKSPCNARATTSHPTPGANPQASDDTVNPVIPIRNNRRRPTRSPSRPALTNPNAKVTV